MVQTYLVKEYNDTGRRYFVLLRCLYTYIYYSYFIKPDCLLNYFNLKYNTYIMGHINSMLDIEDKREKRDQAHDK